MRAFTNKSIKMTPSLQSELMCVDIISNYTEGKFRMIVKTKLGMTCVDARDFDNPRIMATQSVLLVVIRLMPCRLYSFSLKVVTSG